MFTVHPFKIGDKVRCIDASQGLIHGLTYTVKDIMTIHEEEHFVRLEEMDITFWAKRFELVTERKFKVGDKVRCIDSGDWPSLQRGEIYTVAKCDETYVYIDMTEGGRFGWRLNRFELVTERKFKVGDRVKYVRYIGWPELKLNQIYTVKSIEGQPMIQILGLCDVSYKWSSDIFELVTWQTNQIYTVTEPEIVSKFKKDDKVRTFLPCCGLSPGKVYTVTKDSDLYTTVLDDNGNKNSWQTNRFELVIEPVFKIGDKVKCIDASGIGFTVEMIDDRGTINGWNIGNFELVIEPEWNINEVMNTWRDGDISLRAALQQAFDAGKKSK